MTLRKYQQEAVDAIQEAFKEHQSALVVLPTGCGKTVVFAKVIEEMLHTGEDHAMVLAHREELIHQAADKITAVTGLPCEIEMGERYAVGMMGQLSPVIISSVQTQGSTHNGKKRMERFDPADFKLLVIDEAHHATSKSYRACIDWYLKGNPSCRLLGVTATPDRADELALGSVFETVASSYDVGDAIRDGWLVPIEQQYVTVGSLDFSHVKTTAGDLNGKELAAVMEEEQNLQAVAAPVLEILKDKRAIIFAASVKQAERLAEILNRSLPAPLASFVCGETPKMERQRILNDFKEGRLQFVVNVGVLTEGFDDAGVEAVVMARPTKSRALYAQMIGRGTRPAAEIADKLGASENRRELIASSSKPSCLVLDFVGNSGRHKLITSADILGGKCPEEVVARAKAKVQAKGGPANMQEALDETLRDYEAIKAKKEAEAKKREAIKATAPYCLTKVNPFNVYDLVPVPLKPGEPPRHYSEKQAKLLREKLGVDPTQVPYAQGKQLLDVYFQRFNAGLASMKQQNLLRAKGIPVPMTFAEAQRALNRRCA